MPIGTKAWVMVGDATGGPPHEPAAGLPIDLILAGAMVINVTKNGSLWRQVAVTLVLAVAGTMAAAQAPAYFIKADKVRGAQGAMGPACVPNAVFFGGEMVVFRMVVYDAATGQELKFDDIQERGITATVMIDGVEPIQMFYPPPMEAGEGAPPAAGEGAPPAGGEEGAPPEGPPPGADFFRGPWAIPADFPPGMYGLSIQVTDAQGNTATFEPIGVEAGLPNRIVQPPAN